MILRYIPYIQTNFVLGLDGDKGPEPFELTKKFVDLSPGAFPAYSLLSAFGRRRRSIWTISGPAGCLPFPFHFLNNNHAMNVKPKNYAWPEFYDGLIDLTKYSFSWQRDRQAHSARPPRQIPKWMNVVRAVSSEGWGRIKYHTMIRGTARHRPLGARLLRGRDHRAAGVLPAAHRDGARAVLRVPAGRRAGARSERVLEDPDARERADPDGAGTAGPSSGRGYRAGAGGERGWGELNCSEE